MSDEIDDFDDELVSERAGESAQFHLNLDGFEGPIDLLLSLARDQKVDLSRIAILPLAEQYLEFIETARDLNLEVAADYLVMAAWLAYLKSRLLLPKPEPEQAEEVGDMSEALKYQLRRLAGMQKAAVQLLAMPQLGKQRFARGESETFSFVIEPVWSATLYDLLAGYGSIQSGTEARTLTIEATRLYSVEEASHRLRALLDSMKDWTVLEAFLPANLKTPLDRRSATASHLVASLELAREGVIGLRQANSFAPIYLRSREST